MRSMQRHVTRAVPALALLPLLASCGADRPLAPAPDASPSALLDGSGLTTQSAGSDKRGTIVVVLDVVPDDPVDVPFTLFAGRRQVTFTLDDDADPALSNTITLDKLKPGTYTVRKDPTPGYVLSGRQCVSDPQGGAGIDNNTVPSVGTSVIIGLEAAEVVTCTFTVYRVS